MSKSNIASITLALALALGALGCAARVYPTGGAVVVRAPPPAPLYEPVPVSPGPGYVWVDGYWSWGGGRYVWMPGRYVQVRAGAVYHRPRWIRQGRHYRFVPGRWIVRGEPRRYYRRAPPPPSYRY